MHDEIKEKIKSKLNITDSNNITEFELDVTGSTVNKIANKGNTSIYGFNIIIGNKHKKIVAKKKSNAIINNTGILLNTQSSSKFENIYQLNYAILGLKNSSIREQLIYKNIITKVRKYMPKFLGNINEFNENILLLEYFNNSHFKIDDNLVVDFLSELHSYYLNKKEIVDLFKLNYCSVNEYRDSKKFLLLIFDNFVKLYETIFPIEILNDIENSIKYLDNNIKNMYAYYLTLNHGDFTYKNICLINKNLCVYDWEMSSYLNPQFDIVTYLSYNNKENISKKYLEDFTNKYIIAFEKKSNLSIDKEEFYYYLKLNINYFFIIRLMGLLVIHNKMPMPHIEAVLKNWIKLYEIINISR